MCALQVGVEHLLRDINDPSTGTLALQIQQKVTGLKGLLARLVEIRSYLDKVATGRVPINHQITANLQNIMNLLPNLNVEELVRSMYIKTNDMHLVVYVASLVRAILALHGLLVNKIKYRDVDAVLDRDAGITGTATATTAATTTAAGAGAGAAGESKEEGAGAGSSSDGGGAGSPTRKGGPAK